MLATLVGLELVTAAGTTTLKHLQTAFDALVTEEPYVYSHHRLQVGFALLFIGVFAVGVLLTLGMARARVHSGDRTCPECGARTKRVHRKWRHRALAAILREDLSRRRCEFCGWIGLSIRS